MSIEVGNNLGHFKHATIEKGKSALNFSRRAAIPTIVIAGTFGSIIGGAITGMHLNEDKETRDSIDTRVNEENPRKASEEELNRAQRGISDFGKNIRNHIDSNTLTINLPQQIAD